VDAAVEAYNAKGFSPDISADDGLNLRELALLALVSNPDIKVARQSLALGQAQAALERRMPDPQLDFSRDLPTNSDPSLSAATAVGFGFDLTSLLLHNSVVEKTRFDQAAQGLDLQWQEWQLVVHAQRLAIQFVCETQQLSVLEQQLERVSNQFQTAQTAYGRGDIDRIGLNANWQALNDLQTQNAAVKTAHNQTAHALKMLLGLESDASLNLVVHLQPKPISREKIAAQLQILPRVRPDLLALQAGYNSQEAQLRGAILAQFPSVLASVTKATDTSQVSTRGVSVSITLPLFNGNRGEIAVQRVTREKLHHEYQARLNTTAAQVDELVKQLEIQVSQLHTSETQLAALLNAAEEGKTAFAAGDIGITEFNDIAAVALHGQLERLQRVEDIWNTLLGLEVLLGIDPMSSQSVIQAELKRESSDDFF